MTCRYTVPPFGCGHPVVLIDKSKRAEHIENETWCTECPLRKEIEDADD